MVVAVVVVVVVVVSSRSTVESKRERTKKLNCLSIQREEKLWTYI